MEDPKDPGKYCYKCYAWECPLVRNGWNRYGFGSYLCECCIPSNSLFKYYKSTNTGHYSKENDIRYTKPVSIPGVTQPGSSITYYGKSS